MFNVKNSTYATSMTG